MARWVNEGTIEYEETITEGFENAPSAFIGLFEGENVGKQLVELGEYEGESVAGTEPRREGRGLSGWSRSRTGRR